MLTSLCVSSCFPPVPPLNTSTFPTEGAVVLGCGGIRLTARLMALLASLCPPSRVPQLLPRLSFSALNLAHAGLSK